MFSALPSLPIRIIEFIILCIVLHFEKNSLNSNGSFDFINTQFGLAQNPVQENLFVNIFVSPKNFWKIVVFVDHMVRLSDIISDIFGQ